MADQGDTQCRPLVVGVNHKTASLGLRDRLFVEDADLPQVLVKLRDAGLDQAVFLSTCDRVEVHAAVSDPASTQHRIQAIMAQNAGLPMGDLEGKLYVLTGEEAIRHMFAVAGSLDSLVIGEPQVLGQYKAAVKMARDQSMVGADLDSYLQAALHTAKVIRADTKIGEGPVSLSAAAAQVARDIHGDLGRVKALLIGSGDMAELICSDLTKAGLSQVTVTHPRRGRALMTAKNLDCHMADFSDLAGLMAGADIIVTSLGRREWLLNPDMVLSALKARRYRPVYIVDVAVPGDVDPAVNRIDEAFLYDLAELEQIASDGRSTRETEAQAAWDILDRDLQEFWRGKAARSAVPVVNDLRATFEAIREEALEAAAGDAEKATRLMLNRLLHQPTTTLKGLAGETGAKPCSAAEWSLTEQVLRRVFDLDGSDSSLGKPDDRDKDDDHGA